MNLNDPRLAAVVCGGLFALALAFSLFGGPDSQPAPPAFAAPTAAIVPAPAATETLPPPPPAVEPTAGELPAVMEAINCVAPRDDAEQAACAAQGVRP